MMGRRDTLRAIGLAALAGSPLLSACGDQGASPGPPVSTGDLRLVSADVARSAGDASRIPDLVASLGAFTGDLWERLDAPDTNVALSPYSIVVALAMTANGAAAATRSQMLDVLGVSSLAAFNAGLAALTQETDALAGPVKLADGSADAIALASANQLFGDRQSSWGRAFLTVLAKSYGAGLRTVDFRGAPESARTLINAWTSDQTHDRIRTILPEGVIDAMTRLVLVNALYFKAPWDTQFEKQATQSAPFHRADGSSVTVDMMNGQPRTGAYLAGDHYVAARLPYSGETLAMTVALPEAGHEPEALAALLSGGLTDPGTRGVKVQLPRFTFRTPTDLKPPLMALGMPLAFDAGRADFQPMSTTERLSLSGVLHQAFIAVDEDGTEAAAATAAVMTATSGMLVENTVVCDRPFLFVIHDTRHGTPLFVGRVADPS